MGSGDAGGGLSVAATVRAAADSVATAPFLASPVTTAVKKDGGCRLCIEMGWPRRPLRLKGGYGKLLISNNELAGPYRPPLGSTVLASLVSPRSSCHLDYPCEWRASSERRYVGVGAPFSWDSCLVGLGVFQWMSTTQPLWLSRGHFC